MFRKALLLVSFVLAATSVGYPQTQIDLTSQVKGILPPANFANSSLANTTVLYQNYYQGAYNAGTTYSQGQVVLASGSTYVSLQNSNVSNTPSSSPTFWAAIGSGGGGNLSGSLTANTIPVATGTQTLGNSLLTDNGATLTYGGTAVSLPTTTVGNVGSGNYLELTQSDAFGIPGIELFGTGAGQGVTVDASGVYSPFYLSNGGIIGGSLLISGIATVGTFQNGVPGAPISFNQNGGGAEAVQINGGIGVSGAIQLSNGYGTSGQVIVSAGSGAPVAWGAGGDIGGMVYPGAGVANSTGSAWGTSYAVGTAANDLVQLNGSAALPALSGANLTSLPAASLTGTLSLNTTGKSAGLTGCTTSTNGSICYWNGAWAVLAGNASGTNYLQESSSGVPVWAASTTTYPGAGVANSTGSAWGTSYTVGTAASNLVQLNGSSQLPAVSGALLTSLAAANLIGTASVNTTGTAANLTGCSPSTAGSLCYWTGTAWAPLAGNNSSTQVLQETSSGVPSWAAGTAFTYPAAGIVCSTGSAWCSSYTTGVAANNLVQLNGSAQLPAVSGANLTNLPAANLIGTASVNTTGTAAGFTGILQWPNLGNIASASTIAPGLTGGYGVITGTATIQTITPGVGCTGGSYACTYEFLSASGYSIKVSATGGTTNNINSGQAAVGSTVVIAPGAVAFFTYDPTNGLWHYSATLGTNGALTANTLPVSQGNGILANSLLTDNGTTLGYAGTGGLALSGTGAGNFSLVAGSGSLSSLAANSYGFMGPVIGGTPYDIQLTNTASTGFIFGATPATINGVNGWAWSTASAPGTLPGGTGQYGGFTATTLLGSTIVPIAGHFTNLEIANISPSSTCTTPPVFNVYDFTAGTFGVTAAGSSTGTLGGTFTDATQTLSFSAGDRIAIAVSTAGSGCGGSEFVVNAQYRVP